MYAVIQTGGKQYRVAEGEKLDVERISSDGGSDVTFRPVLVVDGDRVVAAAGDLAGAAVTARVVGEAKGPKIRGFTYKNKTNNRRRWGHRQKYTTIEIVGISAGGSNPDADAPADVAGGE
jgi:large subunit ribosomal protein L21